ncbi:MAG: TonB-dependent receptor [Acidobacteria bacterium]|nr:TonB-dependent receptor [Acidobacteriota bacterium]
MVRHIKILSPILLTFIFCISIYGQGTTGQISGVVTDPNGAVIPGATVKVTNAATNQTREAVTTREGSYTVQMLPPGEYTVEVEAQGFARYTVRVLVNITQTTTVNPRLEVGLDAGGVTIEAEAPVVQSETSQQGRVVTGETLRQLPLPTRNFQQLLTLSPGAQTGVSNTTELGRGDAVISVNGQRTTSNSVRINGIDANSIGTNSTPNIAVPATDSLQEFIVQTSLYDASNGRNAGGNVEAVTRSGGNDLHGNVYYFLRRTGLNANDPFVKAAGLERPVLDRNQFGGTLGGPIVRDRAFFFFSYQGTRETNGASLANSLTFPVIPNGLTDSNRTAAGLAAAFGVPAAAITPTALALLNQTRSDGSFIIPSSSSAAYNGSGASVPQSGESTFRENQFNFNGDINFSDKHNLSAKFFIADNPTSQANYNFAGIGNGNTQLRGFGADLQIKQKLYSITDNYVINPNWVNQFKFGFSRIRVTSMPEEPFSASEIGITNPLAHLFAGAPTLSFLGADSSFFVGSSPLADQSSRINAYTIGDTVSWTKGNHRIRFGGEYRFSQVKFYFNAFSRGQINYTDGGGLTAFQNFLTGYGLTNTAFGISINASGVFDRYYKVQDTSFFIQDDWKVSDRLTLNLGLRYDIYGLPYEDQGRLVNLIVDDIQMGAPPNGIVQASGGGLAGVPEVEKTLVPVDKNNFAPRIGFAYDIMGDQKAVIRGGYGMYYDRISTRYANTQLFNFPYLALGVGLVNNLLAPFGLGFRSQADPFVHLPDPSAFPTAASIPSPLSAGVPLTGVPISGVWVDPELRTPIVHQFNVGLQFQMPKGFVGEVGYVGNRGRKLLHVITLNQPIYDQAAGTTTFPLGSSTVFSANKNLTGGNQQIQTTSESNYDSLQMSLSKRFTTGAQFLASYTYGDSFDYYSGGGGGGVNELTNMPGDQWNWHLNGGPSDFNRKHRFVLSGVYDLPKFVDNDNGAKWLVNDWQVAGIAVFQSGLPFSIVDTNGTTIISRGNFASGMNEGSGLYTSGSASNRTSGYFNTAAFVTSRFGTATFDQNSPFGNTPRNFLFGPGQKNVDVSFIKLLPFTEKVRGEFRAEFFNVFNWVNYANPGSTFGTATFGRITSAAAGPRVIQFAFKLGF